ncbi:RNA polymerase sigma factor [Bacteroidota bacterium]
MIERCKNGESTAFGLLIDLYKRQLYSYLWKMCGDKMTAEDLFQETLVKVWRGINRYDERNNFSSWLFSIAHNVGMDYHRKRKTRSNEMITDEVPEQSDNVTPVNEFEAEELKSMINTAVDELPVRQKRVFLLRQHGNMKFKEIANITGEPLNTVLAHMNYAVKKLRKVIEVRNAV